AADNLPLARTPGDCDALTKDLGELLEHRGAATLRKQIEDLREDVGKRWDKLECAAREEYARKNPKEYREIIKRWGEYLDLRLPVARQHDTLAKKSIKAAEIGEDRDQYVTLQKEWTAAVKSMDPAKLEAALGLASDYVERKEGIRRMEDDVKPLLE